MDKNNLRAQKTRQNCMFITTKEAGSYLCLSPMTLEKMRVTGTGPHFRKHGRHVRYHIDDLDTWSRERRHLSTSETGE